MCVQRSTTIVSFLAILMLAVIPTHAKPPKDKPGGGGGGGGGGGNGGGTIYFTYEQDMYQMNDDGSEVTLLADVHPDLSYGDPSYGLHAGKRWFLAGGEPFGIRAYSDAGDLVHIDPGIDVQVIGGPRWACGDAFISFEGRQFDDEGNVVAGGLFEVDFAVDENGNLTGSAGTAVLTFETPMYDIGGDVGLYPDISRHSWFPDNLHVAFSTPSTDKHILVGDIETGVAMILFHDPDARAAYGPVCSPAGDKVMFQYNPGRGQERVMTMNADGTNLNTITKGAPSWTVVYGVWSPTGSHLLYQQWDHFWEDSYIVRSTSSGSGKARLTDTSMGSGFFAPRAVGWRN